MAGPDRSSSPGEDAAIFIALHKAVTSMISFTYLAAKLVETVKDLLAIACRFELHVGWWI